MSRTKFNREAGSLWRRWEPHVHAPGTVLNDQFRGDDAWERYLKVLEERAPTLEAIGVTDYYNLDTYERLIQSKAEGRLPLCGLIFPNTEMRLALGTVKGHWVNVHLLISPEQANHVQEAKRFLSRLTFRAYHDTFACTPDDLIRLGYAAGASPGAAAAALELGSLQFKVSLGQLQDNFRDNAWARANILIAVGGGNDGTSGMRDSADAVLRQEVERFAHIVFASSPAQREFWLGLRKADADELHRLYGGLKPCLHGSDGHEHAIAGAPEGDRYSWVKGDPTFDALRQCCIDPAGRAYVGLEPPISASPSQAIAQVTIHNAPWALKSTIRLNPGLVAIIGARGSGKTALADVIAAGCDALPNQINRLSFLHRAQDLLDGASVKISWGAGDSETRPLDGRDSPEPDHYPRARYLSQQFVESLCSSDGMTDGLLREIERVIYDSHDLNDRDGATDFADLLDMRVSRFREARSREEVALSGLSDRIGTELEKMKLVAAYKIQVQDKTKLTAQLTDDRAKLVAKGSEERMARLDALTKAAEKVRLYVRHYHIQAQQLLVLGDEVKDIRQNQAPETLRETQERHAASGLKDDDWNPFLMDFKGPVDDVLAQRLDATRKAGLRWKGLPVAPTSDPTQSLVAEDQPLEAQSLSLLEAEIKRVQQLVSVDRATAEKFSALSKRIAEESEGLGRITEKLGDAEGAKTRAEALTLEREASYVRVFEAVLSQQAVLSDLYVPIKTRLEASGGTLQKMSFSVTRTADCQRWADEGEKLLDLRRIGPFKGHGTLQVLAEESLRPAWENGDAPAVSAAMKAFREQHQKDLLEHALVLKTQQLEYRAWTKRFAQWLYGTDHISVQYSVDYDGTDIRNLSPGTRGIVLLLLYLALDDADDRPLIVDQPEENLDPKSIYDELVDLFVTAKQRRQVIIVTHNANLVINTDADQIIVASASRQSANTLPMIDYLCGGLEDGVIRKAVCDILEGGEHAFRERARRLRVRLER